MRRRAPALLVLLLTTAIAFGQAIPSPEEFLGFRVGTDRKLARWDRIVEYFRILRKRSDRIFLQEVGKSTNGNPFILAVISSPANLRDIERLKAINRRLFDPRTIRSEEEARELTRQARLFVLVTCSIHATEVGATQMSMEAAHRLVTEDSESVRSILDNVVFLLVPSLNPDGQIMVTDWYNRNLGTPYENAPLPWLYHPYAGHDNNRDAYMFTQVETQLMGRILYREWLPAVWLDEHQMGPSGPRIFIMPAADPINPNVDPLIYRNVGLLGYGQGAALEKAGMYGIIHGDMYTYWWEGAMAWSGWWHNMLGLLTEVASVRIAGPIEQQKADPEHPSAPPAADERAHPRPDEGGILPPPSDVQPRAGYPRPWIGGRWTLRDIVDYELVATFGLLETAARLRIPLLQGLYTAGRRQVDAGKAGDPYAVIIPPEQQDGPTAIALLQTLAYGGVEVHRAERAFSAAGKTYPAGTHVILMAQPFRGYAKDMLEPQSYPQISPAPGVQPKPPYDVAGWSLGMQMGVDTRFAARPFEAVLIRLDAIERPPGKVIGKGSAYLLGHDANNSLVAVNRLLKAGFEVSWMRDRLRTAGVEFAPGAILAHGGKGLEAAISGITRELGVDALALDSFDASRSFRVRAPRTALYQPWGGNIDEGWTRWLLEQNSFAYDTIHPEDVRKGDLSGFDAVLFPDMNPDQILNGLAAGTPPEYRGGIDASGIKALRAFVEEGGSLILLGRSSMLAVDNFSAPFRDALRGVRREDFFCPGSILRVAADTSHPIAYGMRDEANGYFADSLVLEPVPSFSTMQSSIVVRYPNNRLLQSGWLQGESYLSNKVAVAEVRLGKGRMVLIPLRVQHRAQTYGTFKLLFNAILTSASSPPSWSGN